jgi:hypothetical protein
MIRSAIGFGTSAHVVLTAAGLANPFLENRRHQHAQTSTLGVSPDAEGSSVFPLRRSSYHCTRQKQDIVRRVLRMYRCEPGSAEAAMKVYEDDAVFEDAFCRVSGPADVAASFRALGKVAHDPIQISHAEEYAEGRIRIRLVQQYRFRFGIISPCVLLPSVVTLDVSPAGKVKRHEELWHGSNLLAVCAPSRWLNGRLASFLMNFAGGSGGGGGAS